MIIMMTMMMQENENGYATKANKVKQQGPGIPRISLKACEISCIQDNEAP